MKKEIIKDFLKPDWRKLILPVVFIVLFMYTLSFFHAMGLIGDKYNCEHLRLLAELNEADLRNDMEAFNETLHRLWLIEDQFSAELTAVMHSNREINVPVFITISVIDPILPVPRLLQGSWDYPKPSVDYMSIETYDCMLAEINRIKNTSGGLYTGGRLYIPGRCSYLDCVSSETVYYLEKIDYHPPSNLLISANIILLFLEGYLLSCIIYSIYGKLRNRN